MNPEFPAPKDMTVAQLLAQVCRLSRHHLRCQMEKIGLHRGQGFVLIRLLHRSGLPQRELARSMHISPAAVTNVLQRMEKSGWIERRRDPDDQRVVRTFVSPQGKQLGEDAIRAFREMEDGLRDIYTKEEEATLKRLLMKLYEYYAPDDPPPSPLSHLFHHGGESL